MELCETVVGENVDNMRLMMFALYYMSFIAKYGYFYHIRPKQNLLRYAFSFRRTIAESDYLSNIILYDGYCNFCNKWVDLLIAADTNKNFSFSALQSEKGKYLLQRIGKETDDISTVVYIKSLGPNGTESEVYTKSDAALKVLETLGLSPLTAANMLPLSFRDGIYDLVAINRYNFLGKRNECRCENVQNKDRFL